MHPSAKSPDIELLLFNIFTILYAVTDYSPLGCRLHLQSVMYLGLTESLDSGHQPRPWRSAFLRCLVPVETCNTCSGWWTFSEVPRLLECYIRGSGQHGVGCRVDPESRFQGRLCLTTGLEKSCALKTVVLSTGNQNMNDWFHFCLCWWFIWNGGLIKWLQSSAWRPDQCETLIRYLLFSYLVLHLCHCGCKLFI